MQRDQHFFAGLEAMQADDADDAMHQFTAALEADPMFLPARIGRIRALVATGNLEEARLESNAVRLILEARGDTERVADLED